MMRRALSLQPAAELAYATNGGLHAAAELAATRCLGTATLWLAPLDTGPAENAATHTP